MRPISIDELPGPVEEDEPNTERLAGVVIRVPARPGWTREWLERRTLCYRQTATLRGDDPLLVEGAQLRVDDAPGSFEISVTSEDARASVNIVEAAARLPGPAERSFAAR